MIERLELRLSTWTMHGIMNDLLQGKHTNIDIC